jgi:MFS family permease
MAARGRPVTTAPPNPWHALWALVVGFFMILVDATIVTVATPAIMRDLGADVTSVVWVTSAYLLAYAVPLLITGRLATGSGRSRSTSSAS